MVLQACRRLEILTSSLDLYVPSVYAYPHTVSTQSAEQNSLICSALAL
jgi:hypothetical protein